MFSVTLIWEWPRISITTRAGTVTGGATGQSAAGGGGGGAALAAGAGTGGGVSGGGVEAPGLIEADGGE